MQERSFKATEVDDIAREVVAMAHATPSAKAALVALSGDLGAGKTTLTQGIGRALGIEATITSPTFVIEKSYGLTGAPWKRLIHIDAYRIEDVRELEVLGFREALDDPQNLIVLEWPERVPSLIPEHALRIVLMHNGETERIVRYV